MRNSNNRLFDDYIRTDTSYSGQSEAIYTYLNRSALPRIKGLRDLFNNWFSLYKAEETKKQRLLHAFKSQNNREHLGAFFELYLYKLFFAMDFEIEVEPDGFGDKKPDFLLTNSIGEKLLLEATGVYPESIFGSHRFVEAKVIDEINKRLDSPNFFLHMKINSSPNDNPPIKKIVRCLERELNLLNPDIVSQQAENSKKLGFSIFPIIKCSHESWDIEFKALPKKTDARNKPNVRPIGIQSWGAYSVDDVSPIRNTIGNKSSYYGELDIPYILAINIFGHFPDDEAVFQTLYGDLTAVFTHDHEFTTYLKPTGVWNGKGGYQNTRMSGLLTFYEMYPHMITKIEPMLWHHPKSQNPINSDKWLLSQKIPDTVTEELQTIVNSTSLYQYLGIDENLSNLFE